MIPSHEVANLIASAAKLATIVACLGNVYLFFGGYSQYLLTQSMLTRACVRFGLTVLGGVSLHQLLTTPSTSVVSIAGSIAVAMLTWWTLITHLATASRPQDAEEHAWSHMKHWH